MQGVKVMSLVINVSVTIFLLYLTHCVTDIGIKDFLYMCKNEKGYALILALIVLAGIWGYVHTWGVMLG